MARLAALVQTIGSSLADAARRPAALSACALLLTACAAPPPAPVSPTSLQGWHDDPLDGLAAALRRQCQMVSPPDPWPALCGRLQLAQPGLRERLAQSLHAWPLTGTPTQPAGLVTGYYEPVLGGSRMRENDRQVPLYRKPSDLLRIEVPPPGGDGRPVPGMRGRLVGDRVVPYRSRSEIETGNALAGQELLWLDDRVEAFFLQVQGSGRVRLRDGSVVAIGFAESNGQPYRSIGRELIERGALTREAADTGGIKGWLRAHPGDADAVMRTNPRYVFFRELPTPPADAGPPGSLGVPLTPLRSVAADPRRIPPGALLYVDTVDPLDGRPMRRLVVNQDTGAAIVGPARLDLFWGSGERAEQSAGRMRAAARIWLLWPQGLRPPIPEPGGAAP
jgi:membrane-bound lytic murein transglycosylase A